MRSSNILHIKYFDWLTISLYIICENFARDKSGGKKVTYTTPVAVEKNGGWRYSYGNMFYVLLVSQYLTVAQFDDETVQAIMEEALKYEGWTYVYGGDSPSTSFDCSGFVSYVLTNSGLVNTGRLGAQGLYNVCSLVSSANVKPGDLVFFVGTYDTPGVSHVGIYVGDNVMLHCGDPIQYTSINTSYWQSHFYAFGRPNY